MRVTIFLLCFFILILNEYTLPFFINKDISNITKIQLRFFNISSICSLLIFLIFYQKFKRLNFKYKTCTVILTIIFFDFLSGYFHFGYPQKSNFYYLYPYDWLRNKPNILDHNLDGFRGKKANFDRKKEDYVIGFFGGSTGYNGEPPIPNILENYIKELEISTLVINFSSPSSNHNQHLHRLIEFSQFKFDLIIFYGGANEIIQPYYYDFRPGYPYNFYLHDSDTNLFVNVLIKYSNFIGEYDKRFKIYNFRLFNPQTSNEELFNNWFKDIKNNYFQTIKKSKLQTLKIIKPNRCKESKFLAIFQPLNFVGSSDPRPIFMYDNTRKIIRDYKIYDFYNLKNQLKFLDYVHVDQLSNKIIAKEIFEILKNKNFLCINKN